MNLFGKITWKKKNLFIIFYLFIIIIIFLIFGVKLSIKLEDKNKTFKLKAGTIYWFFFFFNKIYWFSIIP